LFVSNKTAWYFPLRGKYTPSGFAVFYFKEIKNDAADPVG
jgi:hypothetical protein